DSDDADFEGSGNYYRSWGGSSDPNSDCNNSANTYFGTAKALDLWALEKSADTELPVVIVPPEVDVDVGTQVAVTPAVPVGGTAFGTLGFGNYGQDGATGVAYTLTIGNPADPSTCPPVVNFTLLPA